MSPELVNAIIDNDIKLIWDIEKLNVFSLGLIFIRMTLLLNE